MSAPRPMIKKLEAEVERLRHNADIFKAAVEAKALEVERLRAALDAIAGFGSLNIAGEYESGLRDIIRSMTDCARAALTGGKE